MNIEWVRRYCMSLPHAAEIVQWNAPRNDRARLPNLHIAALSNHHSLS